MKSMVMLATAGAVSLLLAGCAPELDKTQLSPEEQAWAENIKANYGAWQPPESVPRSVRRDDLAAQNQTAPQETAPAAVDAPAVDTQAPVEVPAAPAAETPAAVEVPAAPAAEAPAPAPVPAADPAVGNVKDDVVPVDAPAPAAAEEYTVVKGDTLGGIARKFYGRASAWKKIQEANADRLRGKNKTVIVPGMKLQIPRP